MTAAIEVRCTTRSLSVPPARPSRSHDDAEASRMESTFVMAPADRRQRVVNVLPVGASRRQRRQVAIPAERAGQGGSVSGPSRGCR